MKKKVVAANSSNEIVCCAEIANSIPRTCAPTIKTVLEEAHKIAGCLRNFGKPSVDSKMEKHLNKVASKFNRIAGRCEMIPFIMITRNPDECANQFENYADGCENYLEDEELRRIDCAQKLVNLAKQVKSSSNVNLKKVASNVKKIVADVSKTDFMKNMSNIENKSRKDDKLTNLVNWQKLSANCPGVSKNSRLSDLTVGDIKEILVSLRGAV